MLEIDGAHGEGGGQLVRTAVALAAIRGTPMRISNVRAGRRNPGLAPQHVAAVRAVASMCDAQCEGLEPRAAAFTFVPKRLQGGQFRVDVGTAGSITLVLQAMLPVAVASGARCRMSIRGGTDVRAAPPIDYLRWVLLPQLARMGIQAVLTVERRGYYPKGGGEVLLELAPARELVPFVVEETGPVQRVAIRAHVARLPREIAERMVDAARLALPPDVHVDTQVEVVGADRSAGPGGAIVLCAPSARTLLGAAQVAERGVRAERLGTMAAESLAGDLRARASLDVHAADQMLVFLALAPGESRFRARELSSHARTSMWLLERFSAARFAVAGQAGAVEVRVSR
jgi:RNA 3'-terminal phosphate cyclase (ATP)